MKKRLLLLQLLALCCAVGAWADNFVYTHTAKYKVTGDNLVTNPNFQQGTTGMEGWQNELGEEPSRAFWTVEPGVGPQGEDAVMSIDGSGGDGSAFIQVFDKVTSGGWYIFSCWMKSETEGNTTTTAGSANYLDLFANTTGALVKADGDTQAAAAESFGTEWRQVAFAVQLNDGDKLVFTAQRLATGTLLAGFELHAAEEVYDTRVAQRLADYVEQLLADENLPEGREDLQGALEGVLKPALQEAQTDASAIDADLIDSFTEYALNAFLDLNGANLVGTTLTDWSTWSKANYNNMSTRNTWTFEGGRWGFTGNEDYLEFKAGDGFIASAGIQTNYTLDVGVRTAAGSLSSLPAGKYFFSIEAQAVAAANRSNPYGANHNVAIVGPMIYVGNDSTTLENDTISGYYWKTYYKIAEVKEGEEIKMGFHFPVVDGKVGGRFSLRNPQVRQLGVSVDDAEFNRLLDAFLVQQSVLKSRLENYPEELKDYPWEQDSLSRAIATAQPVYEASLLIVDAEGNILDKGQVNDEQTQLMLDQVNALGRARNYILSQNAPIQELKDAIEAARESLSNPLNANAAADKRSALQAAVSEGQALVDGISATNQGAEFTAATEKIKQAQEQFESTSANRANPAEILIANADFSDFSAGNNVQPASGETAVDSKSWHWAIGASTTRWEIRDNETLDQGHGASVWRGTTVGLDGKVSQTFELTYEGLYEYRAQAFISEERINELVAAAQIIYEGGNEEEGSLGTAVDTLYTPNIRLFFGTNGAPDSVTVSKCYMGVKNDGTYFTRLSGSTEYPGQVYAYYSVFFQKSGTAPTTVELGFEALENTATAGANGFGFGNNRVFFLGNADQYLADTKADVQTAVAAARELAANNPDSYWTVKLNRYIKNAEEGTTAKELQNALWGISEVSSRLQGVVSAVQGVFAEEPARRSVEGVYTLTGVKVANDATGLKPGLYIINGKKYAIR
ncbi:MAG: hypothetical protein IJ841_10655 [Prevotella sp.]|nr:hypothetical protein [Prevotella sp.]